MVYKPVENNQNYTGIFKSGSDFALIRFSLTHKPDISKTLAKDAYDNFVPSFAVKFLRDGVHSGNLFGAFSLDGAASWNWFRKDFSTHIPNPKEDGG